MPNPTRTIPRFLRFNLTNRGTEDESQPLAAKPTRPRRSTDLPFSQVLLPPPPQPAASEAKVSAEVEEQRPAAEAAAAAEAVELAAAVAAAAAAAAVAVLAVAMLAAAGETPRRLLTVR